MSDGYFSNIFTSSNINNILFNYGDGYNYFIDKEIVIEDGIEYEVVFNHWSKCLEYYYNKKLHRMSGPAVFTKNNSNMDDFNIKQWYFHGTLIENVNNIKDFNKKIKALILK